MRKRTSMFLMVAIALTLVLALACGPSAPPTPTPKPTPTPTAFTIPTPSPTPIPPATPTPTATPTRAAPTPTPTPLPPGVTPPPTPTPTPVPTATPTPRPAPTATPTPAPTPTPTAAPIKPSGAVIMTLVALDAMVGDPAQAPYRNWEQSQTLDITEALFNISDKGDPMGAWLASGWSVAPDGKKITINIRKGIPWITPPQAPGKNFGEVTADDVVWMFNYHNAFTNPKSSSGDAGDYAAVLGWGRVVDKYTAEFDMRSPVFFGVPMSGFGVLGAAPSLRSKVAFDTMGLAWSLDNPVGTGQYVMKEWSANNRGVIEAIPGNHWHHNARIQQWTFVQVPESTSAIAMLKAGQADIGDVDFSLIPPEIEKGPLKFLWAMPGGYVTNSILYSGNLYSEKHPITGDALEPWKSPAYAIDRPWIGNPWGDKAPYTDTDNPAGMSDMEQARLVRWAIEYAIDRDSIVKKLFGGLATPIYSEYMGPEYPGWDANRTTSKAKVDAILKEQGLDKIPEYNVASPYDGTAWPWKVPYDLKKAEELLDKAGYPKKADGTRFEIVFNANRCEIGEVCYAVNDVIAAMLAPIGIKATIPREDYAAVISPRMRQRIQFDLVIKNGDVHSNVWPIDWPYPPVDSALSRPGWGTGFESDLLATMHLKIRAEKDFNTRVKWHLDTVDYMMYWQLYNGIGQIQKGLIYNPKKVASWEAPHAHYSNWNRTSYAKLVGQ
ncbi:MAG: ABC transporter substrate-binding protein [Chloroflexota bacterium]|nr:ABC transporter substrate-binding protein [Chloroflexota bacterium]